MLKLFILQDGLPQPRLLPKATSKVRVLYLEAVIDTDCLAALGLSGRGRQRQRLEEAHVVAAQRLGEE